MLPSSISIASASLPAQPGETVFDRILSAVRYEVCVPGMTVAARLREGIFGVEPGSDITFVCDAQEHYGHFDPSADQLFVEAGDSWWLYDHAEGPNLWEGLQQWLAEADAFVRDLKEFLRVRGGMLL